MWLIGVHMETESHVLYVKNLKWKIKTCMCHVYITAHWNSPLLLYPKCQGWKMYKADREM